MLSIYGKRARPSRRCLVLPIAASLGLALILPGQAFAQSCNGAIDSNVLTTSDLFVGDTVQVELGIGASSISGGTVIQINEFSHKPDCQQADNWFSCTDQGNTVNFVQVLSNTCVNGDSTPAPINWSVSQDATTSEITFTALNGPAVISAFSFCYVNVELQVTAINPVTYPKTIYGRTGYDSQLCDNTEPGQATGSFRYDLLNCAIDLTKYVSVDGGTNFLDANTSPGPDLVVGGTAEFKLEVCNVGTATFVNPPGIDIDDGDLGIDVTITSEPPLPLLPTDCFELGAGDIGALLQPGYCTEEVAIENVSDALATCRVGDNAVTASDQDNAWVNCIAPEIDIIKRVWDPAANAGAGDWVDANTPPGPTYPVGAVVPYQIEVCNIGAVDFLDVEVEDPALGITATSIGPLAVGNCTILEEGVAPVGLPGLDSSIACASQTANFQNIAYADGFYTLTDFVEDDDPANVNCAPPALTVVKTGEEDAKVGDTITYDVCATNDSPTVALENCVATDTLSPVATLPGPFNLAVSGETGDEYCYSYDYVVPSGAPSTIPNTARVDCDVVGTASNSIFDTSDWDVDLYSVGATLEKTCRDELGGKNLVPGDTIYWDIEVCNTGTADLTCVINDTRAGVSGYNLPVPGQSCASVDNPAVPSDLVEAGDAPAILNTATADCTVDNYDNVIPQLEDDDTCPVQVVNELCRTPGFWKTHAGIEKDGRSNNLTQAVIDYSDAVFGSDDGTFGLGTICGVPITDTTTHNYTGTGIGDSDGAESAVEGMCVHPKQKSIRQLMRQLIAASINCVASGGQEDCTGISVEKDWKDANAACVAEDADLTKWIPIIDSFNNGLYPGSNCQPNIQESVVFDGWTGPKVPGPAGSSNACNEATYNDWYLVPLPTGNQ